MLKYLGTNLIVLRYLLTIVLNAEGDWNNNMIPCIIFTNDFELGLKKLYKIKEEKALKGIKLEDWQISRGVPEYTMFCFEDGELWTIRESNTISRGFRWVKAWIDSRATKDEIEYISIKGGHLGIWHEPKYFSEENLNGKENVEGV